MSEPSQKVGALAFMTAHDLYHSSGDEALASLEEKLIGYAASHQDLIERSAARDIERERGFLAGLQFVALIIRVTLDQAERCDG